MFFFRILFVSFLLWFQLGYGLDLKNPLIYLSFDENSTQTLHVNFVTNNLNGNYVLEPDKVPLQFKYQITNHARKHFAYQIENLDTNEQYLQQIKPNLVNYLRNGLSEDLKTVTVCVFSDFRADWMHKTAINLSSYIEENSCVMNLFVGRVVFEEFDNGLSFNPFVMLYDNSTKTAPESLKHDDFASVPSIFGGVGNGLKETNYFHIVEFAGIAIIQFTIEVKTILTTFNKEFNATSLNSYFDQMMALEMECKLQELYERGATRPWIIVHLTHPSMFNEKLGKVFYLETYNRLLDVFQIYNIDLLLVCESTELESVHEKRLKKAKRRAKRNGVELKEYEIPKLPRYLQTTFVECSGNITYAKANCDYYFLEIQTYTLNYYKKALNGQVLSNGIIHKLPPNHPVGKVDEDEERFTC